MAESKIIDMLKKKKATLYFGEGCGACENQIINELGSSYGKIRKAGGLDVSKPENKGVVSGIPTWINKFGDHIVGSHDPETLLKKLNTKQKSGLKFGKVYSSLADQPQFIGHTDFGGRRGGQLGCSSENIANWTSSMPKYTKGNKFGAGGLLARPYGPTDNLAMKSEHLAGSKLHPFPLSWNYKLGQFGRRRSKRSKRKSSKKVKRKSSKKVKRRSMRKLKRKSKRRSFGNTPGSKSWKMKTSGPSSKWVSNKLAPAKGYNPNPALLYLPTSNKITKPQYLNVPQQYMNNQYNDPHPSSIVKFGNSPSLIAMEGPNNVAYRPNFNLYNAGANTVNWATGKTFRPPKQSITKVQKTKNNPRSWIGNAKPLGKASGGFNTARSYTHKGIKGSKFGQMDYNELVFTRNNFQGAKTLYQPTPPYMKNKGVVGDYASYNSFGIISGGKKKNKNKNKPSKKKLQTQFGGKIITLASNGKISISPNPKL